MNWLSKYNIYKVRVYSHQYLKHVDAILNKINDKRRNRERLKEALLEEFNHIDEIIQTAQNNGFSCVEALQNTKIGDCTIIGPTKEEFIEVAAKAIDNRVSDIIGEGDESETVMNAASIQLRCKLDNSALMLLCGDASPMYLHSLDSYDVIQLPHHGQLDDAKAIFNKLKDSYNKIYFVSDNTGSGSNSGGSEKLKKHMSVERYKAALNTQNGIINLPDALNSREDLNCNSGVKLG